MKEDWEVYFEYLDKNREWKPVNVTSIYDSEGEALSYLEDECKNLKEDFETMGIRGFIEGPDQITYFHYGLIFTDVAIVNPDNVRIKK